MKWHLEFETTPYYKGSLGGVTYVNAVDENGETIDFTKIKADNTYYFNDSIGEDLTDFISSVHRQVINNLDT